MTPERWQQVKQIFNSAIQYQPDERGAFLSEVCSGDEALRSEVESLISSHEMSGEFIDAPAYQLAAESLAAENTELQAGQTVGSYEVLSFISRGGMGEVYLAEDKRLRRKVALKLLPASYTRDADRLRRFEQEARAASALNHPNIITIFEVAKAGAAHLIATEFVEGQTLRERLAYNQMSLREALRIAIQVADALAAAHKAGIIHRDIKPENIMLRPDGYVKVLDFGLAKLSEQGNGHDSAEAPTRQVKTGSGIVMGTAGYMSPEQARGRDIDPRSDVFSLGAVIYELVAHRKPFEGETPNDVLASILKTDPQPLSRVAPHAPAELVRIVTKALRKDREERYQVVKDLLIDLRTLQQELDFQAKLGQSGGVDLTDTPETTRTTQPAILTDAAAQRTEAWSAISTITHSLSGEIKRHKLGTALVLTISALVIAFGVFGIYKWLNRAAPVTAFQNIKLTRLTNSGNAIEAIISPDGKYLVYVLSDRSQQSLWVRQVSTANDQEIVPPAPVGFFGITFSHDGTEVFYAIKANMDSGTLYRVPVLGGTPVRVLEKIDAPISFSPDGKRFVLIRGNYPGAGGSALVIANADGSGEQILAAKKLPEKFVPLFFTKPSWSPDGKLIAVTVATVGGPSRVMLFPIDGGGERPLSTAVWPFTAQVEWLADMSGVLVIAGDSPGSAQVWLLTYPGGEKRRITNDLNTYRTLTVTADNSKFSTVQASGLVNIFVVPDGNATRASQLPTGNVGFYGSAGNSIAWTPEGRIVFVSNEGTGADIWSMDWDGKNRKQLTANSGLNVNPTVSTDGRYICFASVRNGARSIWRMNIDGSNPIRLTNGLADLYATISPDVKWVIYSALDGPKPALWKVSIDGGTPVRVTEHPGSGASFSPDGKLLAYMHVESPDPYAPPNRITVMPLTEGTGQAPVTFAFPPSGTVATVTRWSTDGKAILYSVNANNVSNIWSQPIDGSPPKQITDFKDSLITGFAWSRDGKQLACARGLLMRDAVLVTDVK
jgi:serine/threonine protein kinase/Tol biopolymer transport system component